MSGSAGGMRPTDSRSIGNRTQQTVNCDFLHVSRVAAVNNIDLHTINSKSFHQLVVEANAETVNVDIQNLKREVETMRKELREIRRNSGPVGYQAGRAVTVMVHFEDIDVNTIDFDSGVFQEKLFAAFSDASRVVSEHIVLICIKENNGSTVVEIEIQYHFSNDPIKQNAISENLSDFVHILNSGIIYSLDEFGETNILSFSVGPIEGLNCKIAKIKNKFRKSEISFEDSDTLILGDYRLKQVNKQLFIQRYDHYVQEYVGGTVVTD